MDSFIVQTGSTQNSSVIAPIKSNMHAGVHCTLLIQVYITSLQKDNFLCIINNDLQKSVCKLLDETSEEVRASLLRPTIINTVSHLSFYILLHLLNYNLSAY